MALKVRKCDESYSVFERNEFRKFRKKHPEHADKVKKISDFKKYLRMVQLEAALEMQENSYGIIFPNTNAVMFINNCGKTKKRPIDFKETKLYGKVIYHLNTATDMNVMKIMYLNKSLPSTVQNTELYSFFANNFFKKMCSDFFSKNWKRCLQHNIR